MKHSDCDVNGDFVDGKTPALQGNGHDYEGEWENGKSHREGTCRFANDNVYEGFVNSKKHGTGSMKYANGNAYDGEYQKGKKHRKGTYKYANGYAHVGEWKDGAQ